MSIENVAGWFGWKLIYQLIIIAGAKGQTKFPLQVFLILSKAFLDSKQANSLFLIDIKVELPILFVY